MEQQRDKTLRKGISKGIKIYIGVSFLFSWVIWTPLIINAQGAGHIQVLRYQHYIASFGPLIGGIAASLYTGGLKEMGKYFKRVFSSRFSFTWLLAAIGMPVFYGMAAVLIQLIITGTMPDWHRFGLTEKLPGLNIVQTAAVWMVTYGLGEEVGWRGYLLPELKKRFTLLKSSLIVALVWIIWHLPAFLFNQNYMVMGIGAIGWAIGLAYGSVLLAWICSRSNYSVIPVILWHGAFDLLTAGDNSGIIAPICSMLVIVHGIFLSRYLARSSIRSDTST